MNPKKRLQNKESGRESNSKANMGHRQSIVDPRRHDKQCTVSLAAFHLDTKSVKRLWQFLF